MNSQSGINLFAQVPRPSAGSLPSNQSNQNRPLNTGASVNGVSGNLMVSQSSLPNPPRRRLARMREGSFFHEDNLDNYFMDLLQQMNDNRLNLQIQNQLLSSNALKQWLREGLDEFRPNTDKDTLYERQYKGKPQLKLKAEDIGFAYATLMASPHAQKIDSVLYKVIQVMSKELGSNHWTVLKIMRKYVRISKFYPNLYSAEIGNQVYKPNAKLIDAFFLTSDPTLINQNSTQFQNLLLRCIELYFQQYYACIMCIQKILDSRNRWTGDPQQRNLPALLRKERVERSFGRILWENYCGLADALLSKTDQSNQRSSENKALREGVISRKLKIFMYLVRLFLRVVGEYDTVAEQAAGDTQAFFENVIVKLDKNITQVEGSEKINSLQASVLVRQLTQLFLVLFPWHLYFDYDPGNGRNRLILQSLRKTTSDPLFPVRMLLLQIGLNVQIGPRVNELFQSISKSIENGQWAVHNHFWKQWLGLFLKTLRTAPILRYPLLMRHVVWLCKVVMKQEYEAFWQVRTILQEGRPVPLSQKYLQQLFNFLNEVFIIDNRGRFSASALHLLPVFTASLGTLKDNHSLDLLHLLQLDNFRSVVLDNIANTLNLEDKQTQSASRIVYIEEQKDRNIEQEIKLLCRMVQLSSAQLFQLQRELFDRQTNGYSIVVLLCRVFQRLTPQTTHDIKCLRYVLRALDAIFVNRDTRVMLPVALGMTETHRWSCAKVITQMIDLCANYSNIASQMGRQCLKLRSTLSTHLHNIMLMSNSLDEYFPSGSRKQDEKRYERLQQYYKNQEHFSIRSEFLEAEKTPLKAVCWLYHLLLILQTEQLTAVELEVVNQIILKCRLLRESSRQWANLEVVLHILNRSHLSSNITNVLAPAIMGNADPLKQIFGLNNARLAGYMAKTDLLENTNIKGSQGQHPKYASKQYRLFKSKKMRDLQIESIYGEIASALRIIETVLSLNLEAQLQLLRGSKLTEWVIDSLVGKGHVYKVPFTVKLERSGKDEQTREPKRTTKTRGPVMVEHELTTSVNLLYTIASLIDFEARNGIREDRHPSYRFQPKGVYHFDMSLLNEGQAIDQQVLTRAQLNTLCASPAKDSVSVSVLQIVGRLMLLGFDSQVFMGISNRSYPQTKSGPPSMGQQTLQQFFMALMSLLGRSGISIRNKKACLECLSSCLKSVRFRQFVKVKVVQFKQPFIACLEHAEHEKELSLMTYLLLFLNLLLGERPQIEDVRFVKSCIGDSGRFGDKLILVYRTKMRQLRPCPQNANSYASLRWRKTLKECILCKMSLMLYLGILSVLLTCQPQDTVYFICDWIISQSQLYLQFVPSVSLREVTELSQYCASHIEKTILQQLEKGHLRFAQHLFKWLADDIQGSLGQDFAVSRWEAYHRAQQSQTLDPPSQALKALHLSMVYSLQTVQEALSQFYCTVILGVFQRGTHGYYFFKGTPQLSRNFTNSINLGVHSLNRVSGQQMLAKGRDFVEKGLRLARDIIKQIWGVEREAQVVAPKTTAVVLLSQIINTVSSIFAQDTATGSQYSSDASRLLDLLEAYLPGSVSKRIGEEALVVLLSAKLRLAQSVFILSKLKRLNIENIRSYLTSIIRVIDNMFGHLGPLSVVTLEHLILEMQTTNILILQSQSKEMKQYLGLYERKQLMEKIGKGLQMAVETLEDSNCSQGLKNLSIQLFSKIFEIDSMTKDWNVQSFSHAVNHRLSNQLQMMSADQADSQLMSGLFLTKLLSQACANNHSEWTRMTTKILNSNDMKMLYRVSKCGLAQTLWSILEATHIYSTVISLQSSTNWKSRDAGTLFDNLFTLIQDNVHRFDESRVVPSNQIQNNLTHIKLIENEQESYRNSKRNAFQILVQLRMHEMLRYFLLFLLSSFKQSPALLQLCEKTLNTGQLDSHTWERLRISLENACQFLSLFQLSLRNGIRTILDVNATIINEPRFACLPIRTFFQSYKNEEDLIDDSVNTVIVLVDTVIGLILAWKKYDWKRIRDWKPARKALLTKAIQTTNKWVNFAQRYRCESVLKKKKSELSQLLGQCEEND